jgi:hypothetical protein
MESADSDIAIAPVYCSTIAQFLVIIRNDQLEKLSGSPYLEVESDRISRIDA